MKKQLGFMAILLVCVSLVGCGIFTNRNDKQPGRAYYNAINPIMQRYLEMDINHSVVSEANQVRVIIAGEDFLEWLTYE